MSKARRLGWGWGECCYQEIRFSVSCPLWLPVYARRQGVNTERPQHVRQATEDSHLYVEITKNNEVGCSVQSASPDPPVNLTLQKQSQ